MKRRRFLIFMLLTAGWCLLTGALFLLRLPPFPGAEYVVDDFLAKHGRRLPADPKLIFLTIGQDSMLDPEIDLPDYLKGLDPAAPEAEALKIMSGPWPWSRRIYPLLLDRLIAAGARVVAFDLNFPTPTAADADFRAALERYRTQVVIGSNFVESEAPNGAPSSSYTRPSETVLQAQGTQDARIGYVNFFPDADDVLRSANFTLLESELNDHPGEAAEERLFSLAAASIRQLGRPELVPRDSAAHPLRWCAPGALVRRPVYEVFAPETWKRNCGAGALFKDAIVVVGALGNWQHDDHLTLLGRQPGPEIHLNAMAALLHGGLVRASSPLQTIECILLGGLLAAAGGLAIASPGWRLLALAALLAGWGGGALALYNFADFLLPSGAPLLALSLNFSSGLIYDFMAVRRERRQVRTTLERYVSRNVARQMIDNPRQYQQSLGGVVRPITVLFSDVRSFTRLCAQTEPHALVQQLNEYLTAMVDCAFRCRGTLDKFIGDAVMVVWGNALTEGPAQDVRHAIECAFAMQAELARLNAGWLSEGRLPLEIGIALNHGPGVVGNIGSPHRMEFTVMGNAVNVCWRLQERTKLHAGNILIGEAMVPLLDEDFTAEPAGEVLVGETLVARYAKLARREAEGPEGQVALSGKAKQPA